MTSIDGACPLNRRRPHWILAVVAAFVLPAPGSGTRADPTRLEIGTAEGQQHPDFALPDLDGGLLRLSDHRGKKVFLFHFASW